MEAAGLKSTPKHTNARARAALLLALLSAGAWTAQRYQFWLRGIIRKLHDGRRMIMTSLGPIEYTVHGGRGPGILLMHGQPGGYDQGALLAHAAVQHGFRLIAWSRPGYLGTPLSVGRSPQAQADAAAALLAALEIPRAAVVGLSGGGPAALQFALRHPGRCTALVMVSAVSRAKVQTPSLVARMLDSRLFTSNFAGWMIGQIVQRRPDWLARALVPDAAARAALLADPQRLAVLFELAQAGIKLPAERRIGSWNDVQQAAALPVFPVQAIQAPTLVIHGSDDLQVPYEHGLFVAHGVPGAVLDTIAGGTHATFATHNAQVLARLFAFLEEHARLSGFTPN